tara:strand:+ start:20059 stop:21174 length:1116 start_codon:yes stop_codon:yes gene_type:complete
MNKVRYHYFDYLRAIAMLLGIPLHACLAYGQIEYHWVLKDPSHSYLIDIGLDFLRLFRMPLFFVISGFFTALTIDSGLFLQKRTRRLLYPLLVFFILLIVPLKMAWVLMEVPDKLYALDFPFLIQYGMENFFAPATEEKFRHPPNWGHLWFLMYLYVFSLISVPLRNLINFKIPRYSLLILICFSASFLSLFLMKSHWVDQPFKMYPMISLFTYYGTFFFFGWKLFNFKEHSLSKTASLALLAAGVGFATLRAYLEVDTHLGFAGHNLPIWILNLMGGLATWTMVLGTIYSFKNYFNKPNKSISYFVDASYFVYLIHLPIIIVLHIIFNRIDMNWMIKFPLVTITSLIGSTLIFHFVVKEKMIDRFLKGNY